MRCHMGAFVGPTRCKRCVLSTSSAQKAPVRLHRSLSEEGMMASAVDPMEAMNFIKRQRQVFSASQHPDVVEEIAKRIEERYASELLDAVIEDYCGKLEQRAVLLNEKDARIRELEG